MMEFGPMELLHNRVRRPYIGGLMIDRWQGVEGTEDRYLPEEWIGSTVDAQGFYKDVIPNEGQSYVRLQDGSAVLLKTLLEQNPNEILGQKHIAKYGVSTALLVKMLDSGQKLSIQAHPNRVQSMRLFHSPFGKAESWYVVKTRNIGGEKPYMLLGFKEGITREKWEKLFWEQDTQGMLDAMHRIDVKPGDMYLVDGGVPHAIGPGCFVVEVQEPTDYTVTVERSNCKAVYRTDEMCHRGAGMTGMFDCFDYSGYPLGDILAKWLLKPESTTDPHNNTKTLLMDRSIIPYFGLERYDVSTELELDNSGTFSYITVLEGQGMLTGNGVKLNAIQGSSYLIPANCTNTHLMNINGDKPFVCINSLPPL